MGSVLFNIQNETNALLDFTLKDCRFENLYARPIKQNIGLKLPMILSSYISYELNVAVYNMTLDSVEIKSATMESGLAFFELSSFSKVYITNLTMTQIGTFDILQNEEWESFRVLGPPTLY
jgi:hypothetical protein